MKFGEFLINKQVINYDQLEQALDFKLINKSRKKLGRVLVELGYLTDTDLKTYLEEFRSSNG